MAKKNKKQLKQLQKQSENEGLIKSPDFQDDTYLKLKAEMEEKLAIEKAEYEKKLAEIEEQKRIEQENIDRAKKLIADSEKKALEEKEKEEAEKYKQPEELKSVILFNNLDDSRMKFRKRELEKTNSQPKDFRVEKYTRINKLPQKPRTAKLDVPEQVSTMLISSKKEIFEKSNKTKAMKKAKLTQDEKLFIEKMFLEKVKVQSKFINMFQPKGLKIPMYEIYWLVQNHIVADEKIYKNLKNPFKHVPEFEFCDSLVWSTRYFLEMVYTENFDFEFLKKECFIRGRELYKECISTKGKVTAYDMEELSVVLMQEMLDRYRYSTMVVNV